MREPFFIYRARPDSQTHEMGAVDGDTLDLTLDLGFSTHQHATVRVIGVDTAEIYGPDSDTEYQRAQDHREFVIEWLKVAIGRAGDPEWPLLVSTRKDEEGKYGRYMADVIRRSDDARLSEDLKAEYPEVEA